MRASVFFSGLLVAVAVANPLEVRAKANGNGVAIVNGLAATSASTVTLNKTLTSYSTTKGLTFQQALTILNESNDVQKKLDTTVGAANSSAPLTDTASGNVATAVLDFEPVIFDTLNNLQAHHTAFTTALGGSTDLSKTVEKTLVGLRTSAAQLANRLEVILDSTYASAAPIIAQQIDDAFAQAEATFANCVKGKICLPPI